MTALAAIIATFTTPEVARLAGVDVRNLGYWIRSGLVKPVKRAVGAGIGLGYVFDFRGLVMVRAVRDLRDQGLSLQRVRKAIDVLRREWPDKGELGTGAKLITDGREAWLALDSQRLVSLLEDPGQTAWRSIVDVGRIEREIREAVEQMRRAA